MSKMYVHSDCECFYEREKDGLMGELQFCALHAAAPKLLLALRGTLKCLNMYSDMQEDFAPEIKMAEEAITATYEKSTGYSAYGDLYGPRKENI